MADDYPINKITLKANAFFKGSKKDQLNLLLNRIYDTSEMVLDQHTNEFSAVVLDGFQNNQITLITPSEAADKSVTATNTQPKIVKDKSTGKEFVELKIRFVGANRGETAGLKDPRGFLQTDMADAATWVKLHPSALVPVEVYFKNPISFNSLVDVKKVDGVFFITGISPTIARMQQVQTDPSLAAYRWGNGSLPGLAQFSTQGGIIIPDTPANKKKVPGTVFPTKPERLVTSLVGIRGRPATPDDIKNGTVGDVSWHSGIDLGTPMNDPIFAIADGKVVYCTPPGKPSDSAGNYCTIEHTGLKRVDGSDFKCFTRYMHNTSMLVKHGDPIRRGQQIAFAGTTGRSTGPHLHFEARSSASGGTSWEPLWLFGWHDAGMMIRNNSDKTKYAERMQIAAKNNGRMPYSLKESKKKAPIVPQQENQSKVRTQEKNSSKISTKSKGGVLDKYTKKQEFTWEQK